MPNKKDFFTLKNSVNTISEKEYNQISHYLEPIKAFARLSNKSFYVIDYKTKGFEYVSDNPLFLCGHSAEEVKQMGYDFYLQNVTQQDLELLIEINKIGFDFYDRIQIKDRKDYSITYDFHLKNQEERNILVHHKLTPLFLNSKGKIWKALCVVSLSSSNDSGNIKIYKKGSKEVIEYNLTKRAWQSSISKKLSNREKEILRLSIRGFKINEIAEEIFISANTVKFHRKKLFEKLEVSNIGEAISFASSNKLI